MGNEQIRTGTKILFGDDEGTVIQICEEPNTGLCVMDVKGRSRVVLPVGILAALDALREERDGMTEARDRFCGSLNRLAEIVGLSGKQSFAPEAVERQAKFELATLRGRVNDLEGKRFPIQGGPSIPWRMILPHDRQCRRNHSDQDLERIAERKGLSPAEALCVLDGQSWM